MKLPSTPTRISASTGLHSEAETRLHGYWLVLAHIVWIAFVAFLLGLFVISLPVYVAQLYTVSNGRLYIPWQLTPESAQALRHIGLSLDIYAPCAIALGLSIMSVGVTVGGVIFWRKSDDSMALLVALMLIAWGMSNIIGIVQFYPGNLAWQFAIQWLEFFFTAALILFLFLFPDGRFAPSWTRWVAIVSIVLIGGAQYLLPNSPFNLNSWPAPFGSLLIIILFVSIIGAQIYRYRYVANSVQREQIKWVVFALAIVYLGQIGDVVVEDVLKLHLPILLSQFLDPVTWNLVPVLIPISIGIAILRYRLWDIDIIINRTLVYGVLTVSIVTLYVLVVVGLGSLLQAQGNILLALLATGLIAVLFQPLRSRLQRAVNRLVYGERDEPYTVLSRLGQRLEATLAPDAVLSTMVEMVAQALKLPYAAITLKQEQAFPIAASYGKAVDTSLVLSLVYQSEAIGQLLLAPRSKGEPFTPADRRLLDDLARQVSVAAHAVRLTSDLQRSRERLVTTREEERRRLRRDLHDGLGPTLAALNLQAGIVRTLLKSDPVAADALVGEWRTELRAAIADIRRLIYELRPPTLDELGLVGAVRERAAQYRTPHETHELQVMVEAPDALPPLPAAVEVAAYRIAQEGLANVIRHAQARACCIRLWVEDALYLEITDDGIGLPQEHHVGVGLLSMRERADELGGMCKIESNVRGGTRVLAWLPLPKK